VWFTEVKQVVFSLHSEVSGQDLIEYSLLAALIALGAVAGMQFTASLINKGFSTTGNILSSALP
jgi:pilus assembly protein Flp/PilA